LVAALLIKREPERVIRIKRGSPPKPVALPGPAAPAAPEEEREREKKETTLSVLTLNVQTYETCHAQNSCDAITADLESLRPEVLAVQEDWFDSPADQFEGYMLAAKCKAEQLNGRFMANSIYLRSDVAGSAPETAERALQGYELYMKLDEKNKALFRDFFLGHVEALKKRDFIAAYDSRAVGPTSVYGSTVVDKKYTDHNGVLVTFRVLNRR
jgi:hypothetical protein